MRIRGLIGGRKIEGIIFDLDGTLTEIDAGAEQWLAQRLHWLDRVLPQERRTYMARRLMIRVESTINFVIGQLIRFDKLATLTRIQPILDRMRGYPPAGRLQLLPGIGDMLLQLQREYSLALVTTRSQSAIDELSRTSGLNQELFNIVVTRENVRNLLPHSEALILAAETIGVELHSVLVISDSDPILRVAAAAGMATAGVLCGLGQENDLQNTDLILGAAPELTEWL